MPPFVPLRRKTRSLRIEPGQVLGFPNAPSGGGWVTAFDQEHTMPVKYGDLTAPDRLTNPNLYIRYTADPQLIDVTDQLFTKALRIPIPTSTPGGGPSVLIGKNFLNSSLPASAPYAGSLGGPRGWCNGNLYYGVYLRIGSLNGQGFTLSGNPGQKFFYTSADGYGDSQGGTVPIIGHAWTFFSNDSSYNPTYIPQFNTVPAGDTGNTCLTGSYGSSAVFINDGQWHLFECRMTPNTHTGQVPNANGTLQMWMDGVQIANHTNVIHFCYGQTDKHFSEVKFEPIYGAGTNSPVRDLFIDYGRTMIKVIPE